MTNGDYCKSCFSTIADALITGLQLDYGHSGSCDSEIASHSLHYQFSTLSTRTLPVAEIAYTGKIWDTLNFKVAHLPKCLRAFIGKIVYSAYDYAHCLRASIKETHPQSSKSTNNMLDHEDWFELAKFTSKLVVH